MYIHYIYMSSSVVPTVLGDLLARLDTTPFCLSTATSTIEQAIRDGTRLGKEVCCTLMVYHHLSNVYIFSFVLTCAGEGKVGKRRTVE